MDLQQQHPQPKLKIILKPGVLDQQPAKDKPKKPKKKEHPVPPSITLINPTPQENKFSGKIRNVLDGLTFAVQSYIIHNLDNEGTSQAYKNRLHTGLSKIREDFIISRAGHSQVNNPAI